ncbi:MAG: tRNA (adenosine(37)-N6)-threonylcarbamoyltransferase complex transferase subunit TsaD [Candidatus Omnitrophota bacterium]
MYVLGIETSCDETAASVVRDGEAVLSNVVSSSLKEHKKYGGIIPEIASRMHLESIAGVVDCAVKEAGVKLKNIKLVSVTSGPGLAGSLLVGISFAKSLSLGVGVPFLGVDHLASHIYANFLNAQVLRMPFVALIVSGGHTSLFYVKDFDKIDILGRTCDDACGEAFDKVAKILRLGYPGGPVIERLAKSGNPRKFQFRCSNANRPLDFSFSGIKTAVLYSVRKYPQAGSQFVRDVAASFQEAAIDTLINKSLLACELKKTKRLVIGGGVAANNRLREKLYSEGGKNGLDIFFPPPKLCLDNAAMVAGLGYQLFRKGHRSGLDLNMQGG